MRRAVDINTGIKTGLDKWQIYIIGRFSSQAWSAPIQHLGIFKHD